MHFKQLFNPILLLVLGLSCIDSLAQTYTDVSQQVGIDHSFGNNGSGAAVSLVDFDQDGWIDITLGTGTGSPLHFYKNNAGNFERVGLDWIDDLSDHRHLFWIDYDNDGDMDLYFTTLFGRNILYNNEGNFKFRDVTEESGMADQRVASFGATWADFDRNGWIDLYVTNRDVGTGELHYNFLYMNNKDGSFSEVSKLAGTTDEGKAPFCAVAFDYNNDLWPDIHIVHDFNIRSVLLRNEQDFTFADVGEETGVNLPISGMGIAVGDYDNNGLFDIYNSNTTEGNKLLKQETLNKYVDVSVESGVEFNGWGWSVNFLDYDNDGHQDIYSSSAFQDDLSLNFNALYENDKNGSFFVPENVGLVGDSIVGFTQAIGDINRDGYPEIVANNHEPYKTHVWKNSGGENNWLKVALKGKLSTIHGIGSKIICYTDGLQQQVFIECGMAFLAQNPYRKIFGLGSFTSVDSLVVEWLSGHRDVLYDLNVNKQYTITEGQHSPFIAPINVQNDPCKNFIDVSVDIMGNNVSYLWSNGSTSRQIRVFEPGIYEVEVQSDIGTASQTVELTSDMFNDFNVSISTEDQIWDQQPGLISLQVESGTPPFTVSINDGTEYQFESSMQFEVNWGYYHIVIHDSNGCSSAKLVLIDLIEDNVILSVEDEIVTHEEFNIFPNPAQSFLQFQSNKPFSHIGFHNLSGKDVKSYVPIKNAMEAHINIADLDRGLYFVHVTFEDQSTLTRKILVGK